MLNPKQLEELVKSIMDALPPGLGKLPDQVQQNIKASLSAAFSKMDLVTREEFDVQKAVLQKTREKVEALEARVAKLEALHLPPTEDPQKQDDLT
ncbi:accessory factor UbiK family protein [Galenea microaerophila]